MHEASFAREKVEENAPIDDTSMHSLLLLQLYMYYPNSY